MGKNKIAEEIQTPYIPTVPDIDSTLELEDENNTFGTSSA
jgi:hypothetical protein